MSLGATTDFVCGALAGAAADVCLYPLDTLRARAMVRPATRGLIRDGMALLRTEGIPALYKGLNAHLVASVPGNGFFYLAFEAARAATAPHIPSGAASTVAAIAGCLASLMIYTPMEVVKQRAMVTRGAGSMSVLRGLLRTDGPSGLYRGLAAGALTWAPYFSIYFATYDALTVGLFGVPQGEQPQFFTALVCGLAAGVGASALTNPFDVVKTRMQVGSAGPGALRGEMETSGGLRGVVDAVRRIAAQEGTSGFTRGLLPRVMLLAPLSSLTISFCACYHLPCPITLALPATCILISRPKCALYQTRWFIVLPKRWSHPTWRRPLRNRSESDRASTARSVLLVTLCDSTGQEICVALPAVLSPVRCVRYDVYIGSAVC